MPIQIRIALSTEDTDEEWSERKVQRTLNIARLTNTHIRRGYERDPEEVNVYEVLLSNTPDGPVKERAEFRHKYGDDLLTLVHEAVEALGGPGGPYMGLRR